MSAQSWMALAVLALLVGGALGAASPSEAGTGVGPRSAATYSFSVTATINYGYQPADFEQVPTNTTLEVTFTDASDLPHSFTIIGREGWVIPASISESAFSTLVFGDSPPVLFNLNVTGSGDVASGSFLSPGPGWYEFVCTVAGHFQLGMYGFIAFGENLPSNLTTPNRTGIGGGSGSLVVDAAAVAIVLVLVGAYVFWRRRHPSRKMPPESL